MNLSSRLSDCFSLPTQRCFQSAIPFFPRGALFSAYAEVFPSMAGKPLFRQTFLCLRRGVSSRRDYMKPGALLFSAYAEVFPLKLEVKLHTQPFLCLRRGVSDFGDTRRCHHHFSLPTQRCFWLEIHIVRRIPLFSAYAEVFLAFRAFAVTSAPFLCLRRGVS